MGKPIAGRNKFPFGIEGIIVPAVVLKDGTKLTNLRISKQRSDIMYDLLSSDGKTLYKFLKITGQDKNGLDLPITDNSTTLNELIPNGSFCVPVYGRTFAQAGFLRKILLHKYILNNGVLYIADYAIIDEDIIPVQSVTLNKNESTLKVGETETLIVTVLPTNATRGVVGWEVDNQQIIGNDQHGNITALSVGTTTVYAVSENRITDKCVYTVIKGD